MKLYVLPSLLALALAVTAAAQEPKAAAPAVAAPAASPPPALDAATLTDKISYFYGTDVAKSLRDNGVDVNVEVLIQGLKDTLEKKQPKYAEKELEEAMTQFAQVMQAKQQQVMAASATKNVDDGKKFLEENRKRKEVTTTESGLQYEVMKKGDGPKPKAEDTVTVHYQGTLLSGKVFDSSVQRGEPATFPLNNVIPGWTEGVQLMNVGSKYKFFIPSKLAYGERSPGPEIGPNSTLVFEVELLNIGGAPAKP